MIRGILLDVDDTLLDFQACAAYAIEKSFEEVGLVYTPEVVPVFREINHGFWLKIERKELTPEGLYQTRWQRIFDRLGIHRDGPAFEARFFGHLSENATPLPGAMELLRYLAARYTVCAASNAPYDQQQRRLELAGMRGYFKRCFVSERVGCAKPDPAFFDHCARALAPIQKEEILVIGDSYTADIQGGIACGMKTCWFNGKGRPLPPNSPAPDYTVSTLPEIQKFL